MSKEVVQSISFLLEYNVQNINVINHGSYSYIKITINPSWAHPLKKMQVFFFTKNYYFFELHQD